MTRFCLEARVAEEIHARSPGEFVQSLLDAGDGREAPPTEKRDQGRARSAVPALPETQPLGYFGCHGSAFLGRDDDQVRLGRFTRGEHSQFRAAEQFGVPGRFEAFGAVELALQIP